MYRNFILCFIQVKQCFIPTGEKCFFARAQAGNHQLFLKGLKRSVISWEHTIFQSHLNHGW